MPRIQGEDPSDAPVRFPPIADISGYDKLRRMIAERAMIVLLLAAIATACADDPKQAIMNRIEGKIELPRGALPLAQYVRVYAYVGPGVVEAAYYAPGADGYVLREVCFGSGRKEIPCGSSELRETKLNPGERLWIDNHENLPAVDGGGCGYIRVEYAVKAGRVTQVECNGPY